MRHLLYLAVLAGCLVGTLPLEFVLGARVYARWRRLAGAVLPVAAVFVVWDVLAVRARWWTFDARSVLPPRLFGLPVEELLFFLVIPVCAVLTLEAVRRGRPQWSVTDEDRSP